MTCPQATLRIPDLTPAMQRVFCLLLEGQPRTTGDLAAASGLARRTVYVALGKLRDRGLLSERINLRDTRQTWFWIDKQ